MRMVGRMARMGATGVVAGVLAISAGCVYHPTQEEKDQRIREESAAATRDLKQGAKNAVHDLGQVAQGVHDGFKGNNGTAENGSADRVDINSASEARLVLLPGIGLGEARAIVKGRPYRSRRSLVKDGVLTREQYDRIADRITAK